VRKCACLLSSDLVLCDCSGAERGQARALIGGQSLCNLCQITAITRLLLLSALMTPLHDEPGSSSNPHTQARALSYSHTVRSSSADRAGHCRPLNRERRSTSRWEEIKAGWRCKYTCKFIHTHIKSSTHTSVTQVLLFILG